MQFLQILQGQVSGFQNLIKLFNLFSELDSLIFWVTIYSLFFVQNVAQIKYHDE